MIRTVLLTLAMLAGLATVTPGFAQTKAAPALPAISPAQAQSVLDLLKDDAKRAQLIGTLEVLTKALPAAPAATPTAAPPAPAAAQAAPADATAAPTAKPEESKLAIPLQPNSVGAQIISEVSTQATELSREVVETARTATDFPLIWRWLLHLANDQAARHQVIDSAWHLLALLALAFAAELATMRLLRRPIAALEGMAPVATAEALPDQAIESSPGHGERVRRRPSMMTLMRRMPCVLGRFLLDLLPVLVFGGIGYGVAGSAFVPDQTTELTILQVVNAYVIVRVLTCVARMLVAPDAPRLRLVSVSDEAARHTVGWVRRLAAVAAFGFALTEVGVLFGLYKAAHDALLKIIFLFDHLLLVVLVVRNRSGIAAAIRAREGARGWPAMLRNRLAANWHLIASFYIMALWMVWAFEVPDGFARLVRFFFVTAAVVVCARIGLIVATGAVDRALKVSPELSTRYPGLEARARVYHPTARLCVRTAVMCVAAIALLEVWGLDALAWFAAGALGSRLVQVIGDITLTILVSLLVWEAANASIQGHLAKLARTAQAARSARMRTLLPMFRTTLMVTLFVIAGLVVLSEIGVNIAPLLAGAGVLGLAIGFGSQKLVQDIITGLFLLLENTMQVGDVVTLGGLSGTVENLSIRTIRLRALDGSVHMIPFSAVTTVTNMTRDFSYAMMDVNVGLNESPDRIVPILKEIAAQMRDEPRWESAIRDDLDVMGVEKFVDLAWVLRVRLKTVPSQRWAVGRELNRRVKMRFDELAIESPITSFKVLSGSPPPDAAGMVDALPRAAE